MTRLATLQQALEVIPKQDSLPTVRDELTDAMGLAIKRLKQLVAQDVTDDMMTYEPKKARLIGDMALGIMRLGMQARDSDASVRRDQALAALLEDIHRERAAKLIES